MIDERPAWMADGLCNTGDAALLNLFFPGQGGNTEKPKQICRCCPVQAQCLQWALDEQIHFGIFGGTTENERRQLRREHASPPESTTAPSPAPLPTAATANAPAPSASGPQPNTNTTSAHHELALVV